MKDIKRELPLTHKHLAAKCELDDVEYALAQYDSKRIEPPKSLLQLRDELVIKVRALREELNEMMEGGIRVRLSKVLGSLSLSQAVDLVRRELEGHVIAGTTPTDGLLRLARYLQREAEKHAPTVQQWIADTDLETLNEFMDDGTFVGYDAYYSNTKMQAIIDPPDTYEDPANTYTEKENQRRKADLIDELRGKNVAEADIKAFINKSTHLWKYPPVVGQRATFGNERDSSKPGYPAVVLAARKYGRTVEEQRAFWQEKRNATKLFAGFTAHPKDADLRIREIEAKENLKELGLI